MALHPVARVSEIGSGERKLITRGKLTLGIFNVGGKFYAYRNVCPHAGAPVCEGRVSGTTLASKVYEYQYGRDGCILRCPWHGWEFDLENGEHLVDSDTKLKGVPLTVKTDPVETPRHEHLDGFPVECREGTIYVFFPD